MITFSPNPETNHNNQSKHGFSLTTAQGVFSDPYRTDEDYDEEHSEDEHRYYGIGMLENGKIVIVWFTMRGGLYRLITAREATAAEKQKYAEHIKQLLGL